MNYLHLRTQNSELRTQNSELRTQNSELRTQNSELRTQNSEWWQSGIVHESIRYCDTGDSFRYVYTEAGFGCNEPQGCRGGSAL
ncbi:MAG: hypothetical protein C1941_06725 [Prosthecochloris sp.]|nr:hypothetical protein [Prosthecochloris sp.]